jgi:hypothetical protein
MRSYLQVYIGPYLNGPDGCALTDALGEIESFVDRLSSASEHLRGEILLANRYKGKMVNTDSGDSYDLGMDINFHQMQWFKDEFKVELEYLSNLGLPYEINWGLVLYYA